MAMVVVLGLLVVVGGCGFVRACLAALLKYKTTHFKQHNIHFHTLFHSPHIKNVQTKNIQTTLLKLTHQTSP